MIVFCVLIISSPCQKRPGFSLVFCSTRGKKLLAGKIIVNTALQVIMPNSWKKVVFLPAYLYKERVSKASSLVLVSCTHFMHTFYPTRPFRHPVQVTILREETLHRMSCQSEIFLFSVYSHVNTDFKITVPLKRNITQITSTYS